MNNRPNYTGHRIDAYRLMSLLGRGTFGDVYLAEHVDRHAQFAIKLLFGLAGAEVKNFINEVSILARLKHPNIVPLVHFGTGRLVGPGSRREDIPFLVMGYAPGGTLKDRFPYRQRPPYYQVPLHTVVDYIGQVAAALQCAHDDPIGAIIHRDVKPANMLMANDGRIMLSDFGIGIPERFDADSLNVNTKKYLGTPLYTAPEQWISKPVTASDQYSLAVVAYQWLAGRCPFEGTFWQLAHQHSSSSPPPLREKNSSLPASVEAVVLKALEKEPGRRFATVREFATALAQSSGLVMPVVLNTSLQVPAGTTPPPLPPQPRNPSRRTIIAVGVATGLILASGSFAWLVNQLEHAQSATTPTPTPKPSPTPAPGKLLYTYSKHQASVNAISWSPDGKHIASGSDDGTVHVWNATTGNDLFSPFQGQGQSAVRAVAWSPDGKYIAFGGNDPTVQVWDVVNRNYHSSYRGHTGLVSAVVWSPDGRYIASGSYDGTVHVWDITTLSDLFPPYNGHDPYPYAVRAVAWSPDGQHIASTGNDKIVHVWNATTGIDLAAHPTSGEGFAVTWSPDNHYLASGGDDKIVHVWNATTGRDLFSPYEGHSPYDVNAVAWSPDGKRIASGGDDMKVKVWNAAIGKDLFTYSGHKKEVLVVAWSPPAGHRIASAGRDGTVQIWTTG